MDLIKNVKAEVDRHGIRAAVLYCRVSSDKQRENTSIPGQVDYLEKTLQPCGVSIIRKFTEVGSGKDGERPSLADAFEYCRNYNRTARRESDRIKLIAIYDWTRWFRNRDLSSHWRVKFRQIGVMVNCPSKWVDYTDASSVILHSVQEGMAHAEHLVISQRAVKSHYDLAQRGELSGKLPRWMMKTNEIGPNGKPTVVLHPEIAPAYRAAIEQVANGRSAASVYKASGGRKILGGRSTFYQAIRNPVCAGMIIKESKIEGLPDINAESAYPALVSKEVFFRALERLEQNTPAPKTKASDELFPAKGVFCCPTCSGSMTSEMPVNRHGTKYFYYRCSTDATHSRFPKAEIDDLLARVLSEISIAPAAAEYAKKQIKEKAKQRTQGIHNRIAALLVQEKEAAERVKRARRMVVDGLLQQEDLVEIKNEQEAVGAEIAKQQFFKANQSRIAKIALEMLAGIGVIREKATPAEFNYFLRVLFPDGFTVEPGQIWHCRTPRINSIFNISPLHSGRYASIKIETGGIFATRPGVGPLPDENRTRAELYRADFQAADRFYFHVFSKIAA